MGEVVVFCGIDGLFFNLLRVIYNIFLCSFGFWFRVCGDVFVEIVWDDDSICYFLDFYWKNVFMVYVYVLLDGNDWVVILFLEEVVIVMEIKFLMLIEIYSEILEIIE